MGKLEPFDGKRTKWAGLWYHHNNFCFTSEAFNLGDLKKFKGSFRIVVRKNRFFAEGTGRPNYVFILVDSKSDKYKEFEVIDEVNECEPKPTWIDIWDDSGSFIVSHVCSKCGYRIGEGTMDFCPRCDSEMY